LRAVRGVSFTVDQGETLGIVGESGSGKSVSTQTIVGLTPGARISGSARFEGKDLLGMPNAELRRVRGPKIAMIFQDPLSSLHPHYRVGWQIVEMIRAHEPVSKRQARQRAVDLLGLVGIPTPQQRVNDFPHQFSGGMRQRAMIAMALALNPKLLIADEPTTALDVTVQQQILDLLADLRARFSLAMLFISHDLAVVSKVADRIAVMYAGSIVESGTTEHIFREAVHPYTQGLLRAVPTLRSDRTKPLLTIEGTVPPIASLPPGCAFEPRCDVRVPQCQEALPELIEVAPGHTARCPVNAARG
jgi:oligopeptide/dipeptide ABC transporter ATP-binding protein